MGEVRFYSFGSGSSGNCYLLQTEDDALLIDVGVGLRGLKKDFRTYGINVSLIHNVLITHDHADHIKSVGAFSSEHNVPVYATQKVHKGIFRNYSVSKKIPNPLIRNIEYDTPFTVGAFTVVPFNVPHDSSDNVGYFIEACDTNFCLITDAGHVTDTMRHYISRAKNLVIEANHDIEMVICGSYPQFLKDRILSPTGHLSNKDCAEALGNNMSEMLKKVWLCHLSEENNHPELARKTVQAILRSYGIIAGIDFQLEVLKRNSPMGPFVL